MHPTNQPQPVLKQENPGKAERFLKAEIKTLAVIQILIGVIHIGFGGVLAVFIHSNPFSPSPAVLSGYPFWGGITFIVSGSLSIEAEKNRHLQLVNSSLEMNIISSIFSLIGIILFLVELSSSLFTTNPVQKAVWTGMAIMLFLFAATEFSIAVSVSHVGCQATCCGLQNASVFFVPYRVNTDVGAPSAAASSTQVYINAAANP
ncbi:membrane-spanning 4-domains subfamily A member 12-like [Alligator mississippiensis]|uniref:Membrane-spanning 4-domains subfamily A member 12-like n=1 Tax=Alligator mississippiensis TaxID=8496 RepID=A0A151NY22_ALLMI|nr:membrane-spanning 4-domains subfamily A member 12-like [Alligator mississippiensis]